MRLEIDAKVIIVCPNLEDVQMIRDDVIFEAEQFLNKMQAFDFGDTLVGVRVHFLTDLCNQVVTNGRI